MNSKAVFLDKDGTLIENVPFNADTSRVRLLDGVPQGLRALHRAGYKLIIVTNQAGVALGYFTESALAGIRNHLDRLFRQSGAVLDGFYYCPHHPDAQIRPYRQSCFCRKPMPGMLFNAAREHDIHLESSWIIGDILNDVEAGRRADCRAALVDNGNETEWQLTALRRPHISAPDFNSVVKKILEEPSRDRYLVPPALKGAFPLNERYQ